MREFLKGLELDSEMIDTIMAEYGKLVTKDKEELQDLKGQILSLQETSKNAIDLQDKYEELTRQIEQDNAEKKAKAEQEILNKNILDAIGNRQFVNEYTKNSVMNEIKNALLDEANVGKSAKDLFEEITKGKDDLFSNPNVIQLDMPSVDETVDNVITKEAFDKMSYKERVELKESNPALFNKYNN